VASFNKIILVGNLTRDPQLSYTASNVAVCKFGIATNHKRKDREGNVKEEVCFVDCTVFGRAGETFNQYMRKGQPALVEGRLHLNQWTTQ
jgi:single-strand DNA-binding protein